MRPSVLVADMMSGLLSEKIFLLMFNLPGIGQRLLHVAVRMAELYGVGRRLSERNSGPYAAHDNHHALFLRLLTLLLSFLPGGLLIAKPFFHCLL